MIRRPRYSVWLPAAALLGGACAQPAVVLPERQGGPAAIHLDESAVGALAELLRMEDQRTLDTALVSHQLSSSSGEVRGRAALAAGRIGDRAATPLLLHALDDSVATVRARTAFALGELGDTSTAVIAALTGIALRDTPPAAAEAVAALGRLGVSAGRTAVDSLLTRPAVTGRLLHEALLAAWRLPRDAATLAAVVRRTRDPDPEIRWRAAYALARNPAPPALAPLLEIVDDADHRVRSYAVRGLRASLADSAGIRNAALTALLTAVRDSHPHVRINALNLLPAYRESRRSTPVLIEALRDADANVAVAAAQALGQSSDAPASAELDQRAVSTALQQATAPGRSDGLRTAAIHAWIRVDAVGAAAVAAQWADSTRWLLRMHAARALGRAPVSQAAPLLRELARDDHYLVAGEAITAVRSMADSIPDARRTYIEQLGAPHPIVRAAAIQGLAADAGAADLDLLLQAYERARQDTLPDAARAAVNALARLRRDGIPVERVFYLRFGAHGPPRDGRLHRAVIDSIGTPPASWAAPPSAIPVQPLAFYERIVRTYVVPVLAGSELPRAFIGTSHGEIALALASADAPLTVHNFMSLIERGYYSGTRWHRVVPNFVIQDGDPRGDGSGGPGYAIRDEINPLRYERGTLGMALSGPDTGGSQFFITHSPQPHLDGGYTVFGRVVSGMDVVDRVVQDDPILSMRVVR